MKKIKLCVLFGGRSSEYEVSLKSAYSVLSNADREKYDILPVGITKEGDWYFFEGGYESVPDGSWCADTSAMKRVALDLAGAEGIVPLTNFAPLFAKAREYGLNIICHAGDSQDWVTVRDAMSFGVSRIGSIAKAYIIFHREF